jgi:isopenicillin-N epimerase
MSPGGFNAFEHHWSLDAAFTFHEDIGRERIADRIHTLTEMLKEGLACMEHVTLYTPVSADLSSGIVCFDVEGRSQDRVVRILRDQNIIASATPYTPSYARLTTGIFNTEDEIDRTLSAIADIA